MWSWCDHDIMYTGYDIIPRNTDVSIHHDEMIYAKHDIMTCLTDNMLNIIAYIQLAILAESGII
jgi:hypothetical protein